MRSAEAITGLVCRPTTGAPPLARGIQAGGHQLPPDADTARLGRDHQHPDHRPVPGENRTARPPGTDVHHRPHDHAPMLGHEQVAIGRQVRHPSDSFDEGRPVGILPFVLGERRARDDVHALRVGRYKTPDYAIAHTNKDGWLSA